MDQRICIDTRFGLKVRLHEHIDGADLPRSLLVFAVCMAVDFTATTCPVLDERHEIAIRSKNTWNSHSGRDDRVDDILPELDIAVASLGKPQASDDQTGVRTEHSLTSRRVDRSSMPFHEPRVFVLYKYNRTSLFLC